MNNFKSDIKITPSQLEKVIDIFNSMIKYYKLIADHIHAHAYENAVSTLTEKLLEIKSDQNIIISSDTDDYIGKNLLAYIDSIIQTKTFPAYEKFRKNKKLKQMLELQNVYGIGPALSNRLFKKNIRTISQLKKSTYLQQLPSSVLNGLKYYKELNSPIDKKTINGLNKSFKKYLVDNNLVSNVMLCGSARRGLIPNDLDYLFITNNNKISLDELMNILYNNGTCNLHAILAAGDTKYMAIIEYVKTKKILHIDIRLVHQSSQYSALLYFTGSKLFNIYMRKEAIKKGLILNEYGLFKGTVPFEISSEHDIFTQLNIKYLTPKKRSKFWLHI